MDSIDFFKLELEKEDSEILNSNILDYKKKFNGVLSEARMSAKIKRCIYCGKETNSFCNSHSIPAFSLKNIATNGELFYSNALIKFPLSDIDKGVNKSGTFQIICRECDSKIFQEYENPNNYENVPTSQMVAQIAMKNYLRAVSKRLNEYAIYDIVKRESSHFKGIANYMQDIGSIDLNEYKQGFEKAKRLSKKNCNREYHVFYYNKLNYVIPIAFQGSVSLVVDLDGQVVNDIYYENPNYHIEDMHICVFPLKDSSIVMMFVDSEFKRYRNFYKNFGKLSSKEKLSVVNYIIFLYSEDIFFSKEISNDILQNENLIDISKQTSMALVNNPFVNVIENSKKVYDLSKNNNIPNLLSEKYKLR